MKLQQFSQEQIISILKEHEAGVCVPELSRYHGVAKNTIYRWKSKYGGLEVSEMWRLHAREAENSKLKKLLAETMLAKTVLKDVPPKKFGRLPHAKFSRGLDAGNPGRLKAKVTLSRPDAH